MQGLMLNICLPSIITEREWFRTWGRVQNIRVVAHVAFGRARWWYLHVMRRIQISFGLNHHQPKVLQRVLCAHWFKKQHLLVNDEVVGFVKTWKEGFRASIWVMRERPLLLTVAVDDTVQISHGMISLAWSLQAIVGGWRRDLLDSWWCTVVCWRSNMHGVLSK